MSYAEMDHAKWMESQLGAIRRRAHEKGKIAAGIPDQLSEFQKRVVDIVGIVGGGIYNAPIAERIDWDYGGGVSVKWMREMATWDMQQLTLLVFLCHEARIRCQLEGCGPRMMRMSFWPRVHEGDIARRHPNLEEAVESFRNYLPRQHRIIYQSALASTATQRGDEA